MTTDSTVKLTINFDDPDSDTEKRDEQVQRFITELKQMDEVETVDRVLGLDPAESNKASNGFLVKPVITKVNAANVEKLMGFLGDRLSSYLSQIPIKLGVEANGKKLTVKAHNREELKAVMDFITTNKQQSELTNGTPEDDLVKIWEKWFEAVDHLDTALLQKSSDYQQLLLNKYRQQGLDL